MDAEAVRQLRMGLELLSALSDLYVGSYRLCQLDCIILAGFYCWIVLYWLDWIVSYFYLIVSYRLDQETLDFARWLVTAWMGWMGWIKWMGRMDWMGCWWDRGGTDGP